MAGTAAAKDDGLGVVGSAPGARVGGVKLLGDTNGGYMSWFIAGLDWVVARGDIEVVNASLSGGTTGLVDAAIQRATDAGVVVVVAAGNDAVDASLRSPASAPNAITVSAFQDNDGSPGALGGFGDDTFASFSNYGEVVDIAAPGVGIASTSRAGGYVSMSGTSMAAPHVAGAAAVYITTNNVAPSGSRWQTVLDGFRGQWAAGQVSACGASGGRSSEPILVMGGCPGGDTVPPTTPVLTATAGDKQVELSWTAASDASGIAAYRLYRAMGATGAFAVRATVGADTRTYLDTGLVNGTVYRYYVVALDAAAAPNSSGASTIRPATPADTVAPPAPAASATAGDVKVVLAWTGVTDPSGIKAYQVWRGTGLAAPALYKSLTTSARSFTDTMVVNGTQYRYALRAVDVAGNTSPLSSELTATPIDNMPPSVPAPTVVVGDGRLTVKWAASKDSSGVASYTIYRAVGADPLVQAAVVGGTTLTWTDIGLTNGTTYRYAVAATDVRDQTSVLSAIKAAAPRDLTGPAAVDATGAVSDARTELSWSAATDVSGVGGYQVLRAVGTSTTFSRVATVPAGTRTFVQTGLLAGTVYRYQVRAVDALSNVGPASTTVQLVTPTTGMGVPAITYTLGTPGLTTTPVTVKTSVRSDSSAAVGVAAKVTIAIRNSAGTLVATRAITTATTGLGSVRLSLPRGTTYSTSVVSVTAVGRTWDGRTPANSVTVS